MMLWYLGLEPEILMFIAYAQKPPVNAHAAYLVGICLIVIWVCMLAVKAMARMRICAGSPEPSLLGYMICAKIS